MAKKLTCRTATSMTKQILTRLEYFQPGEKGGEAPIPYVWKRDPGYGPLVLVLGDNAGGKSFFRRCVQSVCKQNNVECMGISMEGRETMGPMRSFVYGTEQWRATGQNSASTVVVGIKTCQGRDTPHYIFWDEPDLGLSDSWTESMGQAICEFAQNAPKHTRGIFIVTHSKVLVRELLPAKPHYLHLGSTKAPLDVNAWLEQRVKPRSLDKLSEESHQRFLRISKILKRHGID